MSSRPVALFCPSPATERGRSTKVAAFKDDRIVYTNGRGVFIRSLTDPGASVSYFGHVREATVARVSPSGSYVASGDVTGAVRIWDVAGTDQILKNEVRPIAGRINDLAWDGESKRIIAVGDGKERRVGVRRAHAV
jgi:WD40 repeat protein